MLGVSGGIAAYKSAELVRLLRRANADIRVVMTAAAKEFVTPRTFQALSGERVWSDWSDDRSAMDHIDLGRWAERILIAPATADTLARLAHGRADDLLAAVCLASSAPLAVAPAMNQAMWSHPATQNNIALLLTRGVMVFGPADGEQACGDSGPGRMLEPAQLLEALSTSFGPARLAGMRVLVTAGPTHEALDPVRYLSNRSSGKMGYAVAAAAREAGAEVQLVSGPVALVAPPGVQLITVESAEEMLQAVTTQVQTGCDIFISAAAVADYRPQQVAAGKIKKEVGDNTLLLEQTVDILATVAASQPRPFCVGFAAETEQLEANARKKRLLKGVEMIAANRVGGGLGFESDDNELYLVWEGGSRKLARDSKVRLARQLIEQVADVYSQTDGKSRTAEYHAKNSA